MNMYFSRNNRGYFIWQKSHHRKLIRFDLRTKDFHTAMLRSKVLLSTYYRLKSNNLSIEEIKESLIMERERYIEYETHMQVAQFCWGNTSIQKVQEDIPKEHKISIVAEEWYNYMSGEWRPLTLKGNQAAALFFIKWYGDKTIESVTKAVVIKFKDYLENKYESEISRQTMFKRVSALFNFAIEKCDYISKNPFNGLGYKRAKNLRVKKSISLELHETVLSRMMEGTRDWWLLQILYYTGMRLTEVIQLTDDDYVTVLDNGSLISCISVNDTNGKRVKNKSSIRTIPIHYKLIEKGIMNTKPTFKWKVHNPVSNLISKLFNTEGYKHSAHDYRYGLSDRLRDISGLPDHVRFSILGHSSNTVTDSIYRGKEPIYLMKQAIDLT
ncbi:TPA: phage integrase SAM-like domain-containing protein [Morganella morganii]|nr:phage integrase SAM-like domain-containing protein [Morganella morganii]